MPTRLRNGNYRAQVYMDGVRHNGGNWPSRSAAEDAEKHLRKALTEPSGSSGTTLPDRSEVPTLGSVVSRHRAIFEHLAEHEVFINLFDIAADIMGRDKRLDQVKTVDLDKLVAHLKGLRRAPATINRYLSTISLVLSWAQERDLIGSRPKFPRQKEPEGQRRAVTWDEQADIERILRDHAQDEMADFVYCLAATGCRRDELRLLRPRQVKGNWIHLNAADVKGRRSRAVPVTEEVQEILERRLPWTLSKDKLRYWWNFCKEEMKLQDDKAFTLHSLRHATATRLVEAGVHIRVIQRYLGHTSIETTLKYAHASDVQLSDAALTLVTPQSKQAGTELHQTVQSGRRSVAQPG